MSLSEPEGATQREATTGGERPVAAGDPHRTHTHTLALISATSLRHAGAGALSTCLSADPGPGPSFGSGHGPFEWGWRAVGLCFSLCGGGGSCAGGGVPLGAVLVLSWCGEVSLSRGYTNHHHQLWNGAAVLSTRG